MRGSATSRTSLTQDQRRERRQTAWPPVVAVLRERRRVRRDRLDGQRQLFARQSKGQSQPRTVADRSPLRRNDCAVVASRQFNPSAPTAFPSEFALRDSMSSVAKTLMALARSNWHWQRDPVESVRLAQEAAPFTRGGLGDVVRHASHLPRPEIFASGIPSPVLKFD